MACLYLTSVDEGSGRTALAAALGQGLVDEGRKVGFLKVGGDSADAEFLKRALGLEDGAESVGPVVEDVKAAWGRVSAGKDLVIVEEVAGGEAGVELAKALDAKVVLVVRYEAGMTAEQVLPAAKQWADSLVGVVINAIPERRLEFVKGSVAASLEEAGVKVLAQLPEDRALFAFSVAELARHLGGEILNSAERSDELVQSLMVGAMCVDPAPLYLGLRSNKAVITRGDRPDVQLAAFETPTACLVLTGGIAPIPGVLARAEEVAVPIMVVAKDTVATLAEIEAMFPQVRFGTEKKLKRMADLLAERFDYAALYQALGLAA